MAELLFEKGFLKGRSIKVPEGRFLIVGRAKEAGLPLPDPQLSRRHCKITHTLEGILMEDLGSRNGTYVNGKAITTVKLRHGDQIVFGDQTAQYINQSEMLDSSGEFESEEAEATREIPELQPGQAMLMNPPNIVRGPDSKPATQGPVVVTTLPGPGGSSLLPPSRTMESAGDSGEDNVPLIEQALPSMDREIDLELSAPLPDLPANPISMEETLVQPRKNVETGKEPAPKSKIKKLMDSYKAEVMATKKDDVRPMPKARPATSLRPKTASGQDLRVPASPTEPSDAPAAGSAEPVALRPVTAPGSPGGTPQKAEPAWENENKIEAFLAAADQSLSPSAARAETTASGRDPVKAKTLAMPPAQTDAAAAVNRAEKEKQALQEALIEEELSEEAEEIDTRPAKPETVVVAPPQPRLVEKPDETGTIDTSAVAGANDEIVIDSSRIDRHREIADEIFRAAQNGNAAEEEAEEEADVIEEVDEDFDLDSLEQVAAPTLDLGQLDRSEATAESATGIEVVDSLPEPTKPEPVVPVRPTPPPTTMGRSITPMPSLPPIVVEQGLETMGPNELYSYSDGVFQDKSRVARETDRNLLAPILVKNEEYGALGQ